MKLEFEVCKETESELKSEKEGEGEEVEIPAPTVTVLLPTLRKKKLIAQYLYWLAIKSKTF